MRLLLAASLVTSIALCGVVRAEQKKYTLKDLAALEQSKSWSELIEHLEDVPPAKRKDAWKGIVERAAIGYMKSQKVDRNPLGALIGADHFTKRYPWLRSYKRFMAIRADLGLKGFKDCFKRRYRDCGERLLPFVEAAKGNTKLTLAAAQLIARRQHKYHAIPFFRLALKRTRKSHLAKFCADTDQLDLSMFAALNLPKSSKLVKPALAVAKACWKVMKPDLVNHVDADGKYYRANTCSLLIKRRVLSAAQKAKCRNVD